MSQFANHTPMADRVLRSDGSIANMAGTEIYEPADVGRAAQWQRASPMVDKVLLEDGRIVSLSYLVGGSDGGVSQADRDRWDSKLSEVPNASDTQVGGLRIRRDGSTTYITTDGSAP